ncbi:MAG: RdgB/HAM1 family non-canonical purine NTP pyrophosphatase [Boseongicola sp. SB0662_bin_57]|nr:RdgB/HAM1 family non-canonical purine NTP pyrophosphatase [Boseongicola sp. SB0662_bin_57]
MMRRFAGDRLLVATHNSGKLEEIADLLSGHAIHIIGAADLGLHEPEETGADFIANARIKAHAASRATGLPALADDSGLEINALDGAPGVHTADWAETSSGRDFVLAMTRAYNALVDSGAAQPWIARFCCTFVLAWPDGHSETFEGHMNGRITWPMRGDKGHGYDPIFQPDGHGITFGQMSRPEKNRVSHRADAFRKLKAVFQHG